MINRRSFLKALFIAPAIVSATNIMPIFVQPIQRISDDWSIDSKGNIRYIGNTRGRTVVLELHKWLQTGAPAATIRHTDHIIELNNSFNMSDESIGFLKEGSLITQDKSYSFHI